MIPKFIKSYKDLRTKHRAICDGFLAQALQKTEEAQPFIEEAHTFYKSLKKASSVENLLSVPDHRNDLISACGFSDKARDKLTKQELDDSIKKVLDRIYKESGPEFRENILYRYLLTKGDSLGGRMRNLGGALAGTKLTEKIIEKLSGRKIEITKNKNGKIQTVEWDGRRLLFDAKALTGNNIDVILLNSDGSNISENLLANKNKYLACGELKGGIDPAGADEHWKTANTSLGRIRTIFGRQAPALFFIGAAVETSMAKEIFRQLKTGKLSHVANLHEEEQVNDLVDWLLSL